jgi:hypothetical protein
MKPLSSRWRNITEFINTRPWLCLLLVPAIFVGLPRVPHRRLLRELHKLVPAQERREVDKVEPDVDKLLRALVIAIIIQIGFHSLVSSCPKTIEE